VDRILSKTLNKAELQSLVDLLGAEQVIVNPVELITYERDATLHAGQPAAVVLARHSQDVQRAVRWASERRLPVVARGAGTGLSGGAVAERGGLIIEIQRMDRIVELDRAGRSAVVEPGLLNLKLDEAVKKVGLYFPPDPASGRSTTLGGNIGENSGGPHCFKYGVTTNYITGLEVVLADGQLVRLGGRALDYPEYDFLALLTGSEGTLGIVTQASVRLLRNPPGVRTLMAAFDAVETAGEAVSAIIARGLVPATLEMMDQSMMRIIEDYLHVGLPVDAQAALIIEVDGYPESLGGQMEEVMEVLRQYTQRPMRIAATAEERDQLWYARKSAFGAMARLAPAYLVLDGTVPRSKLGPTLGAVNQACAALGLRVANVFHAGDGNLHPLILIDDLNDQALLERIHQAGRKVMELCVNQGGSITGEHGIGIEKREYMPLMFNADELAAQLEIKEVFDPDGLMNPGKIFPEQVPTDRPAHAAPGAPPTASPYAPTNEAEAAAALRAWLGAGQTVRIRGAGTKSQLLTDGHQVLDTRALSGVRRVDLDDLYVTAGAGTPLVELQAELARHGMWVPLVSPWPVATLGGIAAANFNAPLRMRYGGLRDLILAARVVLPDGRLIRAGRPVVKNVAGYDLPKLFVGAYGSLGLLSELSFKLMPLPRARASLVVPVEDVRRGLDWGARLLQVCFCASALLLCRGCPGLPAAPYALIYTAEGIPEDVAAELAQARRVLEAAGAGQPAETPEISGSQVWADWFSAVMPHPGNGQTASYVLRLGVPPGQVATLLTGADVAPDGGTWCADLASGHVYLQADRDPASLRRAAEGLGGYAFLLAAPDLPAEALRAWRYAPSSQALMRRLKARWDPAGRLNPDAPVSG